MAKKPSKRKTIRFSFLLAILFLLFILFLPGQNIYQVNFKEGRPQVAGFATLIPSPVPYPVNMTGLLPGDLSAFGVLVMDIPSRVILYQKNSQLRLSPASTTKIMTALVAMEKYKMEQILTVQTVISEGRVMGLTTGEQMTTENLLYATLVHSANDAAFTLAENYPEGVEKFVERMNQKAAELFLTSTHFTNPIGFEDVNHFTTVKDLSFLANYALINPVIAKIVGTPAITVPNAGFTKFYQLQNVNQLLGKIPGVIGIKTGWTENAGECLVTAVAKNDRKILTVVLDSKDRFGETERLINWVFGNFNWQVIAPPKNK